MPPDNFNALRMAKNGPQYYEGVVLDDADEEIGLPIMDNAIEDYDEWIGLELPSVELAHELLINQHEHQTENSTTGFEEFDNLVVSPQQTDDLTMHTQYGEMNFKTFMEELIFTLASKYTGYTDLNELRTDLAKDAGFFPDLVVQHFGFPTFTAMMNSDRIKNYVQVVPIEGKMCYLPRDFSRFSHIRDAQEITQNALILGMEDTEREKFMRSQLPQNRDAAIRGRQVISEILYELGGEHRPINWQDIQKKYKQKYGVELAGQELKRMFQRDKALSIIHTLFEKEVTTYGGNLPGHFFLQLKMPYHELVDYYDEQLRTHSEAEPYLNKLRHNKSLPTARHKGVYPIGPMHLQENPAVNRFLEQIPLTSAAAGIQTRLESNSQIEQSATNASNQILQNQSNGPLLPSVNNSQTKSKFDMPNLDAIPKAQPTLIERLAMMNDQSENATVTNSPTKFRFNEEEDVEAYSGFGEVENVPRNEANMNGNKMLGNVNNNTDNHKAASTKTLKYTNCNAPNDMTDSEAEEMDDEDDAASAAITPGDSRPVVRASDESMMSNKNALPAFNLSSNPIQNDAFDQNNTNNTNSGMGPPTSHHHHQKTILNHMMEMANKKKSNDGGCSQITTLALPQRTTTPPPFLRQAQPSQQQNVALHTIQNITNDGEEKEEVQNKLVIRNQPFGNQNNSVNAAFSSYAPFRANPFNNVPNTSSHQLHQINTTPGNVANGPNNEIGQGNFQLSNNSSLLRSNSTTNMQGQGESMAANWQLMDHVTTMHALANRMHLTFEIRGDEGSVIFRNGSAMVLVLTEFDDKIRASKHSNGYIQVERYYPKVDWEMFSQTICGVICQTFVYGE